MNWMSALRLIATALMAGLALIPLWPGQGEALAPDLPTIAESGMPGYDIASWFGLVAPAGLPGELASRLNAAVGRIVRSAEFKEQVQAEGGDAMDMSAEAFGEFIRAESVRWARVVRDAGAHLD